MLEEYYIPHADPHHRLPFATDAWPVVTLTTVYLLFVLKLGPLFMANRQPYKLRTVLKVYNLFQIVFNAALLIKSLHFIITENPYNFSCLVVLPPDHSGKSTDRMLSYLYYINKLVDLLDTVFFVLRKSYSQITLLHLIHHVYMTVATYFLQRIYGFGGHYIVVGLLNLFVHVIMYSYYYFSSQIPNLRNNLWWKRYITIIQMVQFTLMFLHSIWTLMQPDCAVPYLSIFLVLFMSSLMFVMFFNFYLKTYCRPKKPDEVKSN